MSEEKAPLEAEKSWKVKNAGLILLWPYLSTLFEQMELLKDDQFVNELKREHATLLLEYLVWGKPPLEQVELSLNKVLCGISPEVNISSTITISTYTKDMTEGLLRSVIDHWSILQDTTIEGFRESFLQRNGHLGRSDKGWVLEVEHLSYDILLSKLPWSISVVNLSWLKHLIEVKWKV